MVNVKQHYLDCLAQASYSITSGNEVFIIDPRRDVDEYIEYIETNNLKLKGVMLTHTHADFVAGHLELSKKYNTPLYIGEDADAQYPHTPLTDNMEISIGKARFLFWKTPGHTPGDTSLILFDQAKDKDKPLAVFTGDTLFNGDVGRPDLLASFGISQEELVKKLYKSVNKLMSLPDETILYPAHGAGSLCGKSLGSENWSTIGKQREVNYAVKAKSQEEFEKLVIEGQKEAPAYFKLNAVINKEGSQKDLDKVIDNIEAVNKKEFEELIDSQEYQMIDTRSFEVFSERFIPGFINIGLDGWFASWAGTLISTEKPIIFISEKNRIKETIVRLARVGLTNIKGYFKDGAEGLSSDLFQLKAYERIIPNEAELLVKKEDGIILDVRTPDEIEENKAPINFINIPLSQCTPENIAKNLSNKNRPIMTMCAGGYRSAMAASILAGLGYNRIYDIKGGISAWNNR